jgi:hypothetical protein
MLEMEYYEEPAKQVGRRKKFKFLFCLCFGLAVLFAIAFSVLEDPEQNIQFANLFAVAPGLSLIYPNRLD